MSIYNAVYSGIPVYEMMMRNVAVMRRKADSYLNATQILKVAGIDKGRRTKILEKEVQIGEHEKVQGGYGKYQGTWIPFDKGVAVARAYQVEHLLKPLLDYQPRGDDDNDLPKKKPRPKPAKEHPKDGADAANTRSGSTAGYYNGAYNQGANYRASPSSYYTTSPGQYGEEAYHPPNKKARALQQASSQEDAGYDAPAAPLPEIAYKPGERYRSTLMSMFLTEDTAHIPEILTSATPPADLDIDLIIDDQGHTSLHWAAALAKIGILQALLKRGADANRLNFNGESALIRAVLVTNNFDHDTFPEVLGMLWTALSATDKKQRTVLHHIALTAGVKGRMQASRYYLEAMIAFLRAPPSNVIASVPKDTDPALIPGPDLLARIIDVQDKNGDTALNIASRIGNRNVVEGLERAGANAAIANKAGLRPMDCKERSRVESYAGTSPLHPDVQSFGSDMRTALMHKMADFTAAKKQLQRHASDISALRRQMVSFQGPNALDGIDFKPFEEEYDAEKEALKRRVTLLADLCEQNGVIVPPAAPYTTGESPSQPTTEAPSQAVEVIARAIDVPAGTVPALLPGLLQETSGKVTSPQKEQSAHQQLQSNLKTLRDGPGGAAPHQSSLLGSLTNEELKAPQPFVPHSAKPEGDTSSPNAMEVDSMAMTTSSSAADLDQRDPPMGC